jgi:hypothetical protein
LHKSVSLRCGVSFQLITHAFMFIPELPRCRNVGANGIEKSRRHPIYSRVTDGRSRPPYSLHETCTATAALALAGNREVNYGAALALALAGESTQAEKLANDLERAIRKTPRSTSTICR